MNDHLHNLTIGHGNIQVGFVGISKLTEIVQTIKNHRMDIISLNETNLNDSIDTDSLNIPANYKLKREDKGICTRGGCRFIISDKVAYTEIAMNTNLTNIEAK